MRTSILSLLFIVGLAMLIGSSGPLWAQQSNPNISITLNFNKVYYEFGEPVAVEVVVSNTSGRDLLVSKGFSSLTYYLEMRVIDPAGRVLSPIRATPGEAELEHPDAPPAPFNLDNYGAPVRTGPCEPLLKGWFEISQTDDLRTYYPLKFPGKYSAQVELSVMIFKKSVGDQCSINPKDTDISYTVKSSTTYFYMKGSTAIHVVPNQWKLWWTENPPSSEIEVQIIPEYPKTVFSYGINPENYFLNNVPANRVKRTTDIVQAFFDPQAAINSLGSVVKPNWYDIVVLGTLVDPSSGKIVGMFGGADTIRVVND